MMGTYFSSFDTRLYRGRWALSWLELANSDKSLQSQPSSPGPGPDLPKPSSRGSKFQSYRFVLVRIRAQLPRVQHEKTSVVPWTDFFFFYTIVLGGWRDLQLTGMTTKAVLFSSGVPVPVQPYRARLEAEEGSARWCSGWARSCLQHRTELAWPCLTLSDLYQPLPLD